MGRGRNGQLVTQSRKEIKRLEPRKGEVTYGFYNLKQKKRKSNAGQRGFHRRVEKNRTRIIDDFIVEISSRHWRSVTFSENRKL